MRSIATSLVFAVLFVMGCTNTSHGPSAAPKDVNSPPQNLKVETQPVNMKDALAQSKQAATEGLATLQGLATQEKAAGSGFITAEEAKSATLGQPLAVLLVRLDQLARYKPEEDPAPLLQSTSPKVIYPVLVGERVRSAVTVTRKGDRWSATGFGADPLVALARQAEGGAGGVGEKYLVTVPALGVAFSATGIGREAQLVPLIDYPEYGLKKGQVLPASRAFAQLVEPAKRHDGQPS